MSRENSEDRSCVSANLWAVSQSWVNEEQRELIITLINRQQWPIPFPRSTSPDHIQIELLNIGAEYVWADVLCLHQEGNAVDDEVRVEE